MSLSFTVGGARATFEARIADEVAGVLDNAFGAEGDWEGVASQNFGALAGNGWSNLQRHAVEELGAEMIANLLALGVEGRGVYLPTPLRVVSLPLSRGESLHCASLTGLRRELGELAERWELPLDDDGLSAILRNQDADGGGLADPPEVLAFARLALAANEAVRRDCPLWLVGGV